MNTCLEDFVLNTMLRIKNKSEWTYLHCKQVGNLSVSFGKKIGKSNKELKTLRYMGYLHDTGKLYINQKILNSTRKITDEEYEEIKKHPINGYNYLNKHLPNCENRNLILAACLFHHYREDKKGYPNKSQLCDISDELYSLHENKLVEIICICDAFNAIITDRPYSKGKPIKEALDLIIYNANTQFDEELSFLFYSFITEDILKQEVINVLDYPYEDSKILIELILTLYNKKVLNIEDYKVKYLKEYNKYINNKLLNINNDFVIDEPKEKYIINLIEDTLENLEEYLLEKSNYIDLEEEELFITEDEELSYIIQEIDESFEEIIKIKDKDKK